MVYNFDKIVDRKNTNSLKWDVADNELPMWVADMDFETAPEIMEVIQKRAVHGCFGYTDVNGEWYDSYINWWNSRHNFAMQKDWLMFCTGVVPAISSIVRKLTTPAEKVLVQTPVYNIFFNSILNNGRQVLENRLLFDGNSYRIDFDDLETKLSDPQTTLMLLCNPHNPSGNIWSRDELEKIGELCYKHHVVVVSDEIHCDITRPEKSYIPFASVSDICRDNSITCIAPTKAFNLAGIQTSAICVPDEVLRHKVWRGINTDEVAEPNVFAVDAAVAAFNNGGAWLDELRKYVFSNKDYALEYISKEIPSVKAIYSDATYLLWIYLSDMPECASEVAHYIIQKTGLYISCGNQYHGNGSSFIRMNLACPRKVLEDGLHRLYEGICLYINDKINL